MVGLLVGWFFRGTPVFNGCNCSWIKTLSTTCPLCSRSRRASDKSTSNMFLSKISVYSGSLLPPLLFIPSSTFAIRTLELLSSSLPSLPIAAIKDGRKVLELCDSHCVLWASQTLFFHLALFAIVFLRVFSSLRPIFGHSLLSLSRDFSELTFMPGERSRNVGECCVDLNKTSITLLCWFMHPIIVLLKQKLVFMNSDIWTEKY